MINADLSVTRLSKWLGDVAELCGGLVSPIGDAILKIDKGPEATILQGLIIPRHFQFVAESMACSTAQPFS